MTPSAKTCLGGVSRRSSRPKQTVESPACEFRRYRDRHQVERLFDRLKQSRRVATRYDDTAASFLGFLSLAATKLWLADYANGAWQEKERHDLVPLHHAINWHRP